MRAARDALGLKRLELYAHPDDWPAIKALQAQMRAWRAANLPGGWIDALRKDALLGSFVRLHLTECHDGWAIAQTFIPGAPSLEDVTDALDAEAIAAALPR